MPYSQYYWVGGGVHLMYGTVEQRKLQRHNQAGSGCFRLEFVPSSLDPLAHCTAVLRWSPDYSSPKMEKWISTWGSCLFSIFSTLAYPKDLRSIDRNCAGLTLRIRLGFCEKLPLRFTLKLQERKLLLDWP